MLATSGTAGTAGMGGGAQQPSETTAEKQNYGNWVCPSMILVFLQNTIEGQTSSSTAGHPDLSPVTPLSPATASNKGGVGGTVDKDFKLKIGKWNDFKQLIYQIYDARIAFTPDICGGVNTSYMGMDEFLIAFFTLRYRERPEVERHLTLFLAQLKYFLDRWDRARLFA